MHPYEHPIESLPALVKVIRLEVESRLREPISVSDVMVSIDDVECIRDGCGDIVPGSRILSKIRDIVKVKISRGLGGKGYELKALECHSVVSSSGESGSWNAEGKMGHSLGYSVGHCKLLVPATW